MRLIGMIVVVLIGIRFLSDRVITVDVGKGADVIRDIGGYTLNGGKENRRIVEYNPQTGRIDE
jgi:hypothetical protein